MLLILLSINDGDKKLQAKVSEIELKSKQEIYGVQGRLYEKDKEISILLQKDAMNTDAISALSDKLAFVVRDRIIETDISIT